MIPIRILSFVVVVTVLSAPTTAQISANGMATRVNGSAIGRCSVGSCLIHGGVKAGRNLFHRFADFDTRKGINDIQLDTRGQKNIILGIAGQRGFLLNKPVKLSSAAHLFVLSPRGVWFGPGASFTNVPNLLISTSSTMSIGSSRFDVFASSANDGKQLASAPALQWEDQNKMQSNIAGLGLSGHGPIVFDGGRIVVDHNLIIDSGRGLLKSTARSPTVITAGESVRIQGQRIELAGMTISARSGNKLGTIQLNSVDGNVRLSRVDLLSRKIVINAGSVELREGKLLAPYGSIEIKANNSTGGEGFLEIWKSSLDVSPHGAPPDARPSPAKLPSIALNSDGDVRISNSQLRLVSDEARINPIRNPNSMESSDASMASSGLIVIRAKNTLALKASSLVADAQNTKAGQILLFVDGADGAGGIEITQSRLSADNGMGGGKIILASASGIAIDTSEMSASSSQFPVINGSPYGLLETFGELELRPFSFEAGTIILSNSSTMQGISIDDSKLLAHQSTAGGGLEDPRLKYSDTQEIGYLGETSVFSLGYQKDFSNGIIRINSKGGVSIQQGSLIDASSRQKKGQGFENIAGSIGIANSGDHSISISNSVVSARSGQARDPLNGDHQAGIITVFNDGPIEIENTNFSSNADASLARRLNSPQIDLSSRQSQLSFSGNNTLDAGLVLPESLRGLADGEINLHGSRPKTVNGTLQLIPNSFSENPSLAPPSIIYSDNYNLSALFTEQALRALGANRSFTQSDSAGPTSPVRFFPLMQTHVRDPSPKTAQESVAVTSNLDPEQSAGAILEWQKRAVENTAKSLGIAPGQGRLRSIAELRERLAQASQRVKPLVQRSHSATFSPAAISPTTDTYTPAILNLQRDDQPTGTTRITAILLTAQGAPISRSLVLPRAEFDRWIRGFQRQLSRRAPPPTKPERDPGQRLSQALLEPLLPELRARGITALLLEADRGLQAIPYAALPLEGRPLGDAFALTITPSLGLIELNPDQLTQRNREGQMLLAGASSFANGLDPLPMVGQELRELAAEHPATLLLDAAFTPAALLDQALAPGVRQLHVATHANFLPGQGGYGVLYTATGSLSLADLGRALRSRASASPLDLISLSGCVTTLGDEQSELGFVGMALQAGARSGLGTLWEVDDAATAAFFIQFYRQLKQGLPKDQALQATQRAFLRREVRLEGDRLVGPDPAAPGGRSTLVSGLTREQQTLFGQGLNHPYYWAGMVLSGSPW